MDWHGIKSVDAVPGLQIPMLNEWQDHYTGREAKTGPLVYVLVRSGQVMGSQMNTFEEPSHRKDFRIAIDTFALFSASPHHQSPIES